MSGPEPSAPPSPSPSPSAPHWWERDLGGLPVGIWIVVVPAGIGLALLIRHRVGAAQSAPATSGNDGQPLFDPSTGLPLGNPLAGAIDPATGIPFALEQGGGITSGVAAPYQNPAFGNIFGGGATETFPNGQGGPEYITVNNYPSAGSTLASIAAAIGITLQQLQALNPSITSPSQLVPGSQIRIH